MQSQTDAGSFSSFGGHLVTIYLPTTFLKSKGKFESFFQCHLQIENRSAGGNLLTRGGLPGALASAEGELLGNARLFHSAYSLKSNVPRLRRSKPSILFPALTRWANFWSRLRRLVDRRYRTVVVALAVVAWV